MNNIILIKFTTWFKYSFLKKDCKMSYFILILVSILNPSGFQVLPFHQKIIPLSVTG